MHYFIQHYHSPKSSVKNSAEETVALQNQLPIRNFCNISHLAIWNLEKEQHRLSISAEPVSFPPCWSDLSLKLPGLKTHCHLFKAMGHNENWTQLLKRSLKTVIFPDCWRSNQRKSLHSLRLVTPILWSLSSSPVTVTGSRVVKGRNGTF